MIYLDTSVALAHLFSEDRAPPSTLWRERLVSSQLLAYDLWNTIHTRSLTRSHADEAKALLAFVSLIDLTPSALARALEPFPTPIGTLDGLHVARPSNSCAQVAKISNWRATIEGSLPPRKR